MCVVVILVDGLPPRDFWKGVELAPPKKWFHLCSFISHIVLFTSDPILPSWTCIKLFLLLHTFIYYWYDNQTTNSFSPPKICFGPHIHPTHPPPPKKKISKKQDSQLSQQNSQSSVCELLQNTELSSQPEPMTSDAAGSSDLAATGNTALAVPEARAPLSSRLTAAAMRSSPQVKEKKRAPNGTWTANSVFCCWNLMSLLGVCVFLVRW